MRAFRGVVYYLERLAEPISSGRLIDPILARHAKALSDIPRASPSSTASTFEAMARYLRVEVQRSGATSVSLSLPCRAIEDLLGLLDPDVARRITNGGTDLQSMVRKARSGGSGPQPLFDLAEASEERRVRVWLE